MLDLSFSKADSLEVAAGEEEVVVVVAVEQGGTVDRCSPHDDLYQYNHITLRLYYRTV